MKVKLGLVLAAAAVLAGCGSTKIVTKTITVTQGQSTGATKASSAGQSKSKAPSKSGPSFKDGVLTTKDVKIVITSHKIIPPGGDDDYDNKTLIAFWCTITNISGEKTDPVLETASDFTAYQDNNPNRENELEVGPLPDDRFGDIQNDDIKKGGTVEYAFSYELSDLKTPVELMASDDAGFSTLGKTIYKVK